MNFYGQLVKFCKIQMTLVFQIFFLVKIRAIRNVFVRRETILLRRILPDYFNSTQKSRDKRRAARETTWKTPKKSINYPKLIELKYPMTSFLLYFQIISFGQENRFLWIWGTSRFIDRESLLPWFSLDEHLWIFSKNIKTN